MGPAPVSFPSLGLSFLLPHPGRGYVRNYQPNVLRGLSGPDSDTRRHLGGTRDGSHERVGAREAAVAKEGDPGARDRAVILALWAGQKAPLLFRTGY